MFGSNFFFKKFIFHHLKLLTQYCIVYMGEYISNIFSMRAHAHTYTRTM